MTIKRRPRPQRRRQLTALALAIAIPWLVAVTAASQGTAMASARAVSCRRRWGRGLR